MTIASTAIISALSTADYACVNDLIGQFKAIILNDSNVTIISDNNPSSGTARVVVYQVGSIGHYAKVYAGSTVRIYTALLKLDNSTALGTPSYVTIATAVACGVRFLYNSKAHFLTYPSSIGPTNSPPSFIFFDVGDPTGWYSQGGQTWGNAYDVAYKSNSDTAITVSSPCYAGLESGVIFKGVPKRFSIAGEISEYYHKYYWHCNNLPAGGILTDGANYYLCYSAANYGILMKDAVPT